MEGSCQLHASSSLLLGRSPWHLLNLRVGVGGTGWTVELVGTLWRQKNPLPLLGIEQPYSRYQLVAKSQTDLPNLTPTQYRQCRYNVTLRRVPAVIVAVEKQ